MHRREESDHGKELQTCENLPGKRMQWNEGGQQYHARQERINDNQGCKGDVSCLERLIIPGLSSEKWNHLVHAGEHPEFTPDGIGKEYGKQVPYAVCFRIKVPNDHKRSYDRKQVRNGCPNEYLYGVFEQSLSTVRCDNRTYLVTDIFDLVFS